MKVRFKKTFLKDLKQLSPDIRKSVEDLTLNEIPAIKDIAEIKNLKKIKGYESFYRIKLKEYRIGFEYREDTMVFMRVLHRKEIYRYFP